jgi:hypothetical protein
MPGCRRSGRHDRNMGAATLALAGGAGLKTV